MAGLTQTELRALGQPIKGSKVLELGIKDRKWSESFDVHHWRVNPAGQNGATRWDITAPPPRQFNNIQPFDIVINFGYTERISTIEGQEAAWRNIHNMVKPDGGQLSCTTRQFGHSRTGVFFPSAKFYKVFAKLNNYVIEELWIDEDIRLVCCRMRRQGNTGDFEFPRTELNTYESAPKSKEVKRVRKPKQVTRQAQNENQKQAHKVNLEKIENFKVDPAQYDHTCYIIGGGPSLKTFDWNLITPDKFVIAINRAYEVLPNAQIVYLTDNDFWMSHKDAMLMHGGQLVRGAINPDREPKHKDLIMYKLTGAKGYETEPGCLKHGSNSAYAVLNLVSAHYGFKTVYLLGVDMKWGDKGKKTSHWHDGHKRIDPEVTYKKMLVLYDTIKKPLADAGVTVYNTNPKSALNTFPKVPLEEVFKK